MKTAEERLRFKNHFFKLGQGRLIPSSDTTYWDAFWKEPETSSDIYELLTPYDIRTIREQNRANFVLMIRVLILRFTYLAQHENFPSEDAPISELLNCIRFLTKLLPFLFELPEYSSELEDILFWSETFDPMAVATRSSLDNIQTTVNVLGGEEKKETSGNKENIIGVNLVKCLVDLLFIRSFTMDVPNGGEGRSGSNRMMSVWEPGIGTTAKYQTPNLMIDSNRMEVLKFMLILMSTSIYEAPSQIVSKGSKFLTLLVAATPRVELLILVCSLINLLCRSSRTPTEENMLFYNNIGLTEMRHLCVTYAAQLLTLMIVYPLPPQQNLQFLYDLNLLTTAKPFNMARVYIGKLRKENELLYLATYLINVLRAPMQSSKESESLKFNLNTGRQNQISIWATECTMLLWELFQCNKSFRILVGERYLHELLVILLYYVCTYHKNVNHKNSVRIFSYFILYLSSDYKIMDKLFEQMDPTFYESLPNTFKTSPGPVTYRDFIVTQICKLLITITSVSNSTNNTRNGPNLLLTTLVEILYNLIPVVSSKDIEMKDDPEKKLGNNNPRGGLSYAACSSVTQLILKFSNRLFLLEASFNADLLALIFRSVCTAIIKYPKPSRMLLFSMLKNEKVYDQVWSTIYSFSTEYFNGETLVLNSIEDNEDENISPLQQIDSNRSDQVSINSSIESDANESIFMNSFTSPKSRHDSIANGHIPPLTPELDLNFFEDESQAIDSALRPKPPTGMSQKARDKLPKESPLKRSWGGNDSLRIILTIIIPHLKLALKEIWSSREGPSIDSFLLVKYIESTDFDKLIQENKGQLNYDFLPTTPLEPLKFNWSHLSLGWYMSLLFGNIYNAGENVKLFTGNRNKIMKNFSSTLVSFSKFTSGWTGLNKQAPGTGSVSNESDVVSNWVESALTNTNPWAYTSIKLFKIEPIANEGFFGSANTKAVNSIMASPGTPAGVNDMANTLARKFSDFRIRNNSSSSISSMHSTNSIINTPIDEQEAYFGKYVPRNSVTSLHSLNTLNRSRTNTPRNSVCM
ncbi:uncharacterized protein AC631_03506 [Debaryomyces fabryi]|uniref:Protein HID1 n=1 Tax=Debaryomyces fabryi TaxID=58627 RepID=A0A0V1PX18_9ASCO|nr:uncharacterized protein AC631_03506 [Debaryomyces fabryi]KSA00736.1 hypothetical protein AC631_03506 [Debaryomyces fabryi]CUM47121.1 unnamed protein product [Debaryomyces fabryi]